MYIRKGRKEMKKNEILKELLSTAIYLLGALLAAWLFVTFIAQRTVVDGESMMPYLQDKNQLFVDKITYRFSDPKRFDIIVFPPRNEEKGVNYIKRIIGLPGESVQILPDGTIMIDGQELEENYGAEIILPERIGIAAETIYLGEDEYFVMGDNRNHSADSRLPYIGNIKRDEIIGRAWIRIWPLSEFGFIKHK